LPTIDIEKALAWVEDKVNLNLARAQRDEVALPSRSKVLVVTGGPGVGKTSIVHCILKIFHAKRHISPFALPRDEPPIACTSQSATLLRQSTAPGF
jgi:ATP-dependent exoDNAse (exonuclease V) alpha subunit